MRPDLRVPGEDLRVGTLQLSEEATRYVVKVHRVRSGDRIHLFDPLCALEAVAVLVEARLPRATVFIEEPPFQSSVFNMPVTLVQAVGKGDKPDQAVRDATALGARHVIFVHTERAVARSSSDTKLQRLMRVAAQTARQCGRGDIPRIEAPRPLNEALSDLPESPLRLVCGFRKEARTIARELTEAADIDRGTIVLIGPEGGLSEPESEQARALGFRAVTLGPYVLRTEVACSMALATLRMHYLPKS